MFSNQMSQFNHSRNQAPPKSPRREEKESPGFRSAQSMEVIWCSIYFIPKIPKVPD